MRASVFLDTSYAIALSSGRDQFHEQAIQLADEVDLRVDIVPLTEELHERGLQLFRKRPDKGWGLVDCISFIVMRDQNIYDALTTDAHFQQARFRPLLQEEY